MGLQKTEAFLNSIKFSDIFVVKKGQQWKNEKVSFASCGIARTFC